MATISIIALCYNHSNYLDEALSALTELPASVQILVADDASTDGSQEKLKQWEKLQPGWSFFYNKENSGNCRTFNHLLRQATGDWVLDYATDDVLIPEQLLAWAKQAADFRDAGFCYADAFVFRRKGETSRRFSRSWPKSDFPEGYILPDLFRAGLICPPAVLFSRNALLEVGGYNEELSYEDLDAWLRLARRHPVCRYPEAVIHYRKHAASMSARIYQGKNRQHLQSTLKILESALSWPGLQPMPSAVISFIRYQLRLCFFLQLPEEAAVFYSFLDKDGIANKRDRFFKFSAGLFPGITVLYGIFLQARQDWEALVRR